MSKSSPGLGGRSWLALILFGLFGQVAWCIENMYFNVFLYKTVTYDPNAVAVMVAASAAVATLATLLMGVLSDRKGKRKPFIAGGYVAWGLSIMAFGLISRENTARLFPGANAVALTVAVVVAMDCVMTFFGSTANDAAFNAWVTDVTVPETRGRAEGVLSALPLLAILILFGGLDFLAKNGNWALLYLVIGGAVSLSGFLGLFLIKDKPGLAVEKTDLLYGFRPSVVRANPQLYLLLAAMGIFSISMQVFFPYLMIYLEFSLALENYAALLGIVLVCAAAVSVLGGRLADKYGKRRFFFPAGAVLVAGLALMYVHGTYLKENLPLLAVFAVLMMGANLLLTALFNASIRDYMPEAQRGHFNGIRMIFFVLIPMVAGPFIGARIIKSGPTYLDEFGAAQIIPNAGIFLGAAVVALAMFVPTAIIYKKMKQEEQIT
ncbi:MAG: MFS transporter [Oscillospiraceae bacterium]|jgi:MFS family permease|nr:MFS transporter [Oscillospiraceae bacterium]